MMGRTMARYADRARTTVVIELTEVAGKQEELLEAFGECQSGRCACPTNEYEKLAVMEVVPARSGSPCAWTKSGVALDSSEIASAVSKIERDS